MEENTRPAEPTPPGLSKPQNRNYPLLVLVSSAFMIAAVILAGKGLYTVYDNSYSARIIGGDAYNFIIYATRGTALICSSIVCAVLSVAFAIYAHAERTS